MDKDLIIIIILILILIGFVVGLFYFTMVGKDDACKEIGYTSYSYTEDKSYCINEDTGAIMEVLIKSIEFPFKYKAFPMGCITCENANQNK